MTDDSTRTSARKAQISIREFYEVRNREPIPGTASHIDWMVEMEEAFSRLSYTDVMIVGDFSGPTRGMTPQ